MTLAEYFKDHPRAALAFSGGVDSAYLLWAGKHYGCDLTAYYVHTAFQPEFEFRDARLLSQEVGVPMALTAATTVKPPFSPDSGRPLDKTAIPCCWMAPMPLIMPGTDPV